VEVDLALQLHELRELAYLGRFWGNLRYATELRKNGGFKKKPKHVFLTLKCRKTEKT
jgi:hypothetical protein